VALAAALRRQSVERPRKGTAAAAETGLHPIPHNAAFCKIAPFATLCFAPWLDRCCFAFAPSGLQNRRYDLRHSVAAKP
jgi:hypothetical protein